MLIAWLFITLISSIIFYYIYSKTHRTPFLIFGALAYTELLFRSFDLVPKEFFIPLELICIVWVLLNLYKMGQKGIILIVILQLIFYLFMQEHVQFMEGMGAFVFSLIALYWFKKNSDKMINDPFINV